tara:strand:- start:35 stop:595 length:561 start_codon:yes stop_codon:yes gene_type:complete
MAEKLFLNGYQLSSDLFQDRAFHYGDGVFETIAVSHGALCLWNYHVERLLNGCETLGLDKFDPIKLQEEAQKLANGYSRAVLKIIISSGGGARGYSRPYQNKSNRYMSIYPWPEADIYNNLEGLRVQWCKICLSKQPFLAGVKHLNRLEQVLARRELRDEIDEGLMCDTDQFVIEGTSSNIFLKKK